MNKNSNLLPSICTIKFVDINDVSTINTGSISTRRSITLKAGKSFTDLYITPGTIKWGESSKKTAAGDLFQQRLEGFFPGDDEQNIADIATMLKRRFIVKTTYTTGFEKIFGSKTNPVKFSCDNDSTQHGRKFLFECDAIEQSYIYESNQDSGS